MKPEWFNIDDIPYNQMWLDDIYWMPLFLRGQRFKGEFWFDKNGGIDRYQLNEVPRLD